MKFAVSTFMLAIIALPNLAGARPDDPSQSRFTSMKSLMEKIPQEARPPNGSDWQDIHFQRSNEWLKKRYENRPISMALKIMKIGEVDKKKNQIVCQVEFEYFSLFGIEWSGMTLLLFPQAFGDELAKMRLPKTVRVTGTVAGVEAKKSDNGAEFNLGIDVAEMKPR